MAENVEARPINALGRKGVIKGLRVLSHRTLSTQHSTPRHLGPRKWQKLRQSVGTQSCTFFQIEQLPTRLPVQVALSHHSIITGPGP